MNQLYAAFLVLCLTGCAALLPSKQETVESPWDSFDSAKSAFDLVHPGQTTIYDLHGMQINPNKTPNIKRMNYLEVAQFFMPAQSITKEDLPAELSACLAARDDCFAYRMTPTISISQRDGWILLDILGFQKKTSTTGWRFDAIVVVNSDMVVYKVWSGEPVINTEKKETTPLGPFQSIPLNKIIG